MRNVFYGGYLEIDVGEFVMIRHIEEGGHMKGGLYPEG
jgi:hypothetical protein